MKSIVLFLMLTALPLTSIFGAEVYGTITERGKPIKEGLEVQVFKMPKEPKERPIFIINTKTQKNGSYSIVVKEKGEFLLRLILPPNSYPRSKDSKEQNPGIAINSYNYSVRYNLILERSDGEYRLRRK